MESLSRCIANLEDCDDDDDGENTEAADRSVAASLWTKCDDLCLALSRLHSHAMNSDSSLEDRIDVLKKLFTLQTSPSSSALSPSHDEAFSSEAALTAVLLDDAYESKVQQQQQSELEIHERIVMLTRTLRFYVHHHQQHEQCATPMLDTLVRLHRRHLSVDNKRDSLSCIEKAVALYAEASKEQQQLHHIASLRVMLYRAHLTMGHIEQVRRQPFPLSYSFLLRCETCCGIRRLL